MSGRARTTPQCNCRRARQPDVADKHPAIGQECPSPTRAHVKASRRGSDALLRSTAVSWVRQVRIFQRTIASVNFVQRTKFHNLVALHPIQWPFSSINVFIRTNRGNFFLPPYSSTDFSPIFGRRSKFGTKHIHQACVCLFLCFLRARPPVHLQT